MGRRSTTNETPSLDPVYASPPGLWLLVGNGFIAAYRFVNGEYPEVWGEALVDALQQYPILGHPEFPRALEVLANQGLDEPAFNERCRQQAKVLARMHVLARTERPNTWAAVQQNCSLALIEDPGPRPDLALQSAVELLHVARDLYGPSHPEFVNCLANESDAHLRLVVAGVAPRENAEAAVRLSSQARGRIEGGDAGKQAALALVEHIARRHLFDLGFDAELHAAEILRLQDRFDLSYSPAFLSQPATASVRDRRDDRETESRDMPDLGDGTDPSPSRTAAEESSGRLPDLWKICSLERPRASYWLDIAGSREALRRLVTMGDGVQLVQWFHDTPILMLPELVEYLRAGAPRFQPSLTQQQAAAFGFILTTCQSQTSQMPGMRAWLLGRCALDLMNELGTDPKINHIRAIELFESARTTPGLDDESIGHVCECQANALFVLAGMVDDGKPCAAIALARYREARSNLARDRKSRALCLANESATLIQLAPPGREGVPWYEEAIAVANQARAVLGHTDANIAPNAYYNAASAHSRLAPLAADERVHRTEAVRLNALAREAFRHGSFDWARSAINEAIARVRLAEFGVDVVAQLNLAIERFESARAVLTERDHNLVTCLSHYSEALSDLARAGVAPRTNLEAALRLHNQLRGLRACTPDDRACSIADQATVLRLLAAQSGDDAITRLREAALAFEQASASFGGNLKGLGRCLVGWALTLFDLADQGVDPPENFGRARALFGRARSHFDAGDVDFAMSLSNEAILLLHQFDSGVGSPDDLVEGLDLCKLAHKTFDGTNSANLGRLLVNEGNLLNALAAVGNDPLARGQEAIRKFVEAREYLPPTSFDFATALLSEAASHWYLAIWDRFPDRPFAKSRELIRIASTALSSETLGTATLVNNEAALVDSMIESYVHTRKRIDAYRSLFSAAEVERWDDAGRAIRSMARDAIASVEASLERFREHRRLSSLLLMASANLRRGLAAVAGDGDGDGVDPAAELRSAIGRLQTARELDGSPESLLAANCRLNEAAALERLSEHVSDRRSTLECGVAALEKAIPIYQRLGNRTTLVNAAGALGRLNIALAGESRNPDEARVFWARAASAYGIAIDDIEAIRSQIASMDDLRRVAVRTQGVYEDMVHASARIGRNDDAVAYLERYRNLAIRQAIARSAPRLSTAALSLANIDSSELSSLARGLSRPLVFPAIRRDGSSFFLVTPSGAVEALELPRFNESKLLEWLAGRRRDGALGGWLGAYFDMRNDPAGAFDSWKRQISVLSREIHDQVMGPLRERLLALSASEAVIVGAGNFGLLPLQAAARIENGTERFFGDEIDLTFVPTACFLSERGGASSVPPGGKPVMLGVIDPAEDLEGARREWSWIVEALGEQWECRELAGSAASRDRVLSALRECNAVHFAGHGRWDFSSTRHSAIELAHAGLITAEDLFDLGPIGPRLVVLSACESALGIDALARGSEDLGLAAGFLIAGARAVVSTLWPVDDTAMALLMARFYQEFSAGAGPARALRAARTWFRSLSVGEAIARMTARGAPDAHARLLVRRWKNLDPDDLLFAHPYYWGGVQVVGSPDP